MSASPGQVSRSVSPDSTRALSEQAGLIGQLLSLSKQLASQHQSLANECQRELEGREVVLLAKDAEVDRLLNAETQLREELEQQLTVEQQHWCLEKDALQKVLQEQQGTAHALEQHLTNQITALQHQLAKQHTGQETAARSHQDTVAALQTANQQLQQQCGRLEQDLHAALAYRHKCIQQKEELQQLRKHTCEARVRPEHDQGFAGDNADAPAEALQHGAGATHAHAGKLKELAALVTKLKSERELVKKAYNEEKKKADRYRNAYTQLRDLKQPSQRRNKQRAASGTQSLPQLPQLQCRARLQGDAMQLATSDEGQLTTAAPDGRGSRLQKPVKPRRGPTEHNCFTAEMDLAAAGLLGQLPLVAPAPQPSNDQLQPGLSWLVRHKHGSEQEQKGSSRHCKMQHRGQETTRTDMQQDHWGKASPQDLSPGAKEALILAGLLSEDQDVEMIEGVEEGHTSEPSQQQQPATANEQALQPWQARLAGHAEAIQQLDRDSLCRMSDPCQQPSKRSRSCPPDSFGPAPHQPADSSDAIHMMHSSNENSDGDEATCDQVSDTCLSRQNGQIIQSNTFQQHSAAAGSGASCMGVSKLASMAPAVAAVPAQQQDSLDMTQPNLTPAAQQQRQQVVNAQGSTDPRTAPIRPFPCTSPVRLAADLVPDLDSDRLAAAAPSSSRPQAEGDMSVVSLLGQGLQQQQQQQQQRVGRKGSGPPDLGRGKAAKWKQRAGQRDTGFGENEQPMVIAQGSPRRQDGAAAQACWLQQGAGHAAEGPALLGDTAQRAGNGSGFKYQDVVRRKAERAALEGIQCLDCRNFYEAVGTWGHQGGAMPACGHALLPGTPAGRMQETGPAARPALHQDASRHRYRFAPPATPDGLWDMGFGDSQDSRM